MCVHLCPFSPPFLSIRIGSNTVCVRRRVVPRCPDRTHTHAYVHTCIHACMCVYVCVCVCARACGRKGKLTPWVMAAHASGGASQCALSQWQRRMRRRGTRVRKSARRRRTDGCGTAVPLCGDCDNVAENEESFLPDSSASSSQVIEGTHDDLSHMIYINS